MHQCNEDEERFIPRLFLLHKKNKVFPARTGGKEEEMLFDKTAFQETFAKVTDYGKGKEFDPLKRLGGGRGRKIRRTRPPIRIS